MKSSKLQSVYKAVAETLRRSLFNYLRWAGLLLAAAPTDIQTLAGATLAVSATEPATFDAAGFGATTMTYTAIGKIEDFGSHGLTRAIAKLTPVDTAVVIKRTGSKDYGNITLKIGRLASDAGQVILKAASESNNSYAFKLTYSGGTTPEIHYLNGVVSSFVYADATADTIATVTCILELDHAPVIVAAT